MALTDTKEKDTGGNFSEHLKAAVNVRRQGAKYRRKSCETSKSFLHICQ